MKKFFICLFALCLCAFSYGQQDNTNIVLLDQIEYDVRGNDVWGYTAPDGTEYALMGLRDRVSIVSLADPNNITEVAAIFGAESTWRDLKSWSNFAYVSNESAGGVAIIDMSDLPNGATSTNFQPLFNGQELQTIHNLYIDESGFLYVAGSNLNGGGVIIYDLTQDPANPVLAGAANAQYAHDVYARGDIMYTSDINAGVFTVHDVSDKSNIQVLAAQSTPFAFTHNAWLSDDGNTIFTTDERGNAPTGAYDISDLNDIEKLGEFRPLVTIGNGVIPHNVHVINDFLVISHYTDGIVVVDANRPTNMVEVGNYDTFSGPDGGFSGCWGAFPFFDSEIILASNSEGRLDVLMPTYVRACYLEGNITDADDGSAILDANVEITTTTATTASDLMGAYATGFVTAGTYEVTYSHPAYFSQTVTLALENGVVTMQDVALMPKPTFVLSGQVVSALDNMPIDGAKVFLEGESGIHNTITNPSGNFTLEVLQDTYEMYAGKWGYQTKLVAGQEVSGPVTTTIMLEEGIKDEFILDLGWTVESTALRGIWERGEPLGTQFFNGQDFNPDNDITGDLGDQCYVTGNGGGSLGEDDVDDGITVLTSPRMDISTMVDPYVTYFTWFANFAQQSEGDDRLEVRLTDGNEEIIVETITGFMQQWNSQSTIRVKDFFPNPTGDMQVIFETGDYGQQQLVEAGIDLFEVVDIFVGVEDAIDESIELIASPNPFNEQLIIDYSLENVDDNTRLNIRNALGQVVYTVAINNTQGIHTVNQQLDAGIYFVQITNGQMISQPVKVIATK